MNLVDSIWDGVKFASCRSAPSHLLKGEIAVLKKKRELGSRSATPPGHSQRRPWADAFGGNLPALLLTQKATGRLREGKRWVTYGWANRSIVDAESFS